MPPKILTAKNTMIEKVAAEMAAVFYEAGRSSGMTSKHRNARSFAAANLEKFIPKAVETLLEMMKPTSNCTPEMREEIYEALQERLNDPELLKYMPNPDNDAIIQAAKEKEYNTPLEINTEPKTVLHNITKPPPAPRH